MVLMSDLGPLAGLAGTWEGDDGLDVSFSHERGEIAKTPYRERATFSPFGPVDNGTQHLFGLDYRTAAWREFDDDPFHTEVGYWLWDAATATVVRCFMVPRGSTILAGGTTTADAKTFTMRADCGSETFGILSNPYLAEHARCARYEVTITLGDDQWSYDELSVLEMGGATGTIDHTDRNTLRRVR
jgi:hypothetical protein